MNRWVREIGVGAGLAIVILALLSGFDFSLFLLPLSMLALAGFVIGGRGGLSPRFNVNALGNGDDTKIPTVTFNDIGGQDMAKREFLEALAFLKESDKTSRLGIRPLKGVLLTGPPGTGKTLMAKAAANYTESVFLTASGSQFVQMYAGVGANRVRQIFKQARTTAEREGKSSAIIFIDEIDVLGAKRGKNVSHMEYDQTLNELLTQIDGIRSEHPVQILVVGATNRSDLLDPALLRPGRFDRIVQVDLPDKSGRLRILHIHAANKPLAPEVKLETVAAETSGFSGAHLESLLNEAAIGALRDGRESINQVDLREAIEKVMLGEKSNRSLQKEERERVAFHEVGHAIISEFVRPGSVASITIASRNQALGYIRQNPQDDQYLYTKDQLLDSIKICVAGAVSEELIFGQRSTGAVGDIEQATDLAKRMVFAGLSPLGIVSTELPANNLHEAIVEIIADQEANVKALLQDKIEVIRSAAKELLEEESISGDAFRELIENLGNKALS
ncbi:MAG TPA: ATPase [Firmicutes bacterium]|nr:ATPase [Bacillota bacterium]